MMAIDEPGVVHRLRRDARVYAANLVPMRGVARFCILTNGRTGSSLLVDLLDSLPHVRCHGEILSGWRDFPKWFVRGSARAAAFRGASAYGLKINTLSLAERFLSVAPRGGVTPLLRWMADDGFVFIFVGRRNLLRQALSVMKAEAQQRYHRTTSDVATDDGLVVDIPAMLASMRSFEFHEAGIKQLDIPIHHTVYYEDDLASPASQQATVDAICHRLGLPSQQATTRLVKTGQSRLEDEVLNYDDLAAVVRKTQYAHFLDA